MSIIEIQMEHGFFFILIIFRLIYPLPSIKFIFINRIKFYPDNGAMDRFMEIGGA